MKIIVGLGNPEEKYKITRHNFGFLAIKQLAQEKNLSWKNNPKLLAQICQTQDLFLVKPQTYMNSSGEAILKLLDYYKLLPRDENNKIKVDTDLTDILTIIHDELDIEFGKYKLSKNSSSAGHRGVQSIINLLHTQNFTRLRLGIKNEQLENIPSDKFVLQKFSPEELEQLPIIITQALGNL